MRNGLRVFRQGFTCPDVLWVPLGRAGLSITGLSPSPAGLPKPFVWTRPIPRCGPHPIRRWFGLLRLRSPLLTESITLSFPLGTKMFQFPRCRAHATDVAWQREANPAGFPHSDIDASSLTSSSAPLFAGSRVLLRLLVPRHSLCALQNLTSQVKSASFSNCLNSISRSIYVMSLFASTWFDQPSADNDRKNMLCNIRFSKNVGRGDLIPQS